MSGPGFTPGPWRTLNIETSALLSANHQAEMLAKALHLAFWLRGDAPIAATYHLSNAHEHFQALVRLMAELEPKEAAPLPPEGEQ